MLFEPRYYLARNPDLRDSRWPLRLHYLLFGGAEGRDPHPMFQSRFYLDSYPDVKSSGLNPLVHYVLFGASEGRLPHPEFQFRRGDPGPANNRQNPLVELLIRPSDPRRHAVAEDAAAAENAKLEMLAAVGELAEALRSRTTLVSVIIPCFNYGQYLWECLASVLCQSYPHVEVIVVDDGSTDSETLRVLESIRHERVIVIHQSNQGLARTRNNGAALARGDYLLFLDADDRLQPQAIAILLYALEKNPSAAYAYPYQRFFGDQDLVWAAQEFNAFDLLWSNHPSVCSLISRRSFEDAGGYRPELLYGYEDWEFWVRASRKGRYGICVPAPLFEHRRHGKTMTHTAHSRQRFLHAQIVTLNEEAYLPEAIAKTKRAWRPAISVIIPFYNTPRYLPETLASLQAQTTGDFEVILVNDGSDDSQSLQMLEELRAAGSLRVLDCEHRGASAARNSGARAALGELIMFLDSDDLLAPDALEKLAWILTLHRDLAFVYSGVVHFGDIDAVCYDEFDPERLRQTNYLTVTCLMRRDVYLELGGSDESIDDWEDYDFWLRLIGQGHRGALFREPLFCYRRHGEGTTARLRRSVAYEPAEISRVVRERLASRAAGLPPLRSDAGVPVKRTPDELLDRVTASFTQVVSAGVPQERYRRPGLPNLFCPRHWTQEKTRLLYLVPSFWVGGAEAFDLRIFSLFPREQYSIILVACEQPDGPWYDRFRAEVDEVHSLERMAPDRAGRLAFLRYLLIARSIDVVFNRNTSYGYELAATRRAVTGEVRYVDLLHLHASGEDWVRASAPYHDKLDLRYVTSADLKQHAVERYNLGADRFQILYHGLTGDELPDAETCAARRRALRHELAIPESAFVVGFIGRLTDQKDPLRWVSVAARVAESKPDAIFLITGDGELLEQTRGAIQKRGLMGRTVFTGYRSEAGLFGAAMDVLLMTSKYEGMPLVILETLAHGTPVVSSDVGGIRECLTPATGRILPLQAHDGEYAQAVMDIGRQAGTRLISETCRRSLVPQFTAERMRRRLEQDLSGLTSPLNRDVRRRDYQLELMAHPIIG